MDKRNRAAAMELRIMVVGSSGSSQFQLTNSILGREEYSKKATCMAGSRKCTGELAGRRVAVVNGPNIYDKDISETRRKMEVKRAKCLSIPGPHVLLVVFDLERISPNDIGTPKLVMKHFGTQSLSHCMVVLAYEGTSTVTLDDKVLRKNWHLRELIEVFEGRFHVFSKNWRDRSQDRELLQKMERVMAVAGGSYLSDRTFQRAEDSVRKAEKKLKKQREPQTEKALSELEKQYGGQELVLQKDACHAGVEAEIRAKAEMDNAWLRTSLVRGVGMGLVAGGAMGALVGSVEGPGGMTLVGIIGGTVGAAAGAAVQVAIKNIEDRVTPPTRVNFNSIFINRFFAAPRV